MSQILAPAEDLVWEIGKMRLDEDDEARLWWAFRTKPVAIGTAPLLCPQKTSSLGTHST